MFHTTQFETEDGVVVFIHDGDYSGHVTIRRLNCNGLPLGEEIELPEKVLRDYVASQIRDFLMNFLMSKIEQMSTHDLLSTMGLNVRK